MKRILLRVSLFIFLSIWGQYCLFAQLQTIDFETTAGYTTTEFSSSVDQFWKRFDKANEEAGSGTDDHDLVAPVTGVQGNFYFASEDIDSGPGGAERVLITNALSVTASQNLEFRILVAAPGSGYDAAQDYLIIEYSYNGTTFTKMGQFSGGTGNLLRVDADFDGDGASGTALTAVLTEFIFAVPKLGTSLQIRVRGFTSAASEEIVFDNLRVLGVPTTDATAPALVITRNPVTLGSFAATTDASVSFNLAFSELIDNSSFTIADIAIGNPGGVTFTAPSAGDLTTSDNQNYTFTINGITAGNGALDITVGPTILDLSANAMAAAEGPSAPITIDNSNPAVTSIVPIQSPSRGFLPMTGTITASTGIASVTGVGTAFTTELFVGAVIRNGANTQTIGTVLSITSDTQLTLTANASNNITNGSFVIRLYFTVTFDEPMDVSTVTTSDFVKGTGTATGTTIAAVGPVTVNSGPPITASTQSQAFRVSVDASGNGTWRLDKTNTSVSDLAGNTHTTVVNGTVAAIDNTAPNAPGVPTNTGGALISLAENGNFDVTVASLTAGTVANVNDVLQLYIGGVPFAPALTRVLQAGDIPGGYTFTNVTLPGPDGAKVITARVTDQAGNLGAASAALNLTLETVLPTFASTAPTTGATVSNTNVSFTPSETLSSGSITWSLVAGTDAGAPHVQALVGTELNTSAKTNVILTNNPILVNGATYDITFSGTDAAGNTGTVTNTGVIYSDNVNPSNSGTVGAVTATGGARQVAGYLNSTNTNVSVIVPLANTDGTLDGGTVIIRIRMTAGAFTDVTGSGTSIISAAERAAGSKTISVLKADLISAGLTEGLVGGLAAAETSKLIVTAKVNDNNNNPSGDYTPSATQIDYDNTLPQISGVPAFADNGGARETVTMIFSEAISMANAAIPLLGTPGFSSSTGLIRSSGATAFNSGTNTMVLESNANGDWTVATTITWTAGGTGNILIDPAGNETATVTKSLSDATPPVLITGMVFRPNGAGKETITFQLSESLILNDNDPVTGFTPSLGALDPALSVYTGKGTTNTITLTSFADGQWTDLVTVAYSLAGNVTDPSANELAAFAAEPILLQSVNISSNNTLNPATQAKLGNTITVTFTVAAGRTLSVNPVVTIGTPAQTATRDIAVVAPNYKYDYNTTPDVITAGNVAFSITANETAPVKQTVTNATTNTPIGSAINYDKTAPVAPSVPDLAAADDSGINNDNYTNITSNLTFTGTCENNAIIEVFDNVTPLGTAITTGTSWTIDLSLATGTYAINAKATDAAANTSVASGNLALTIDNTPPGVTSVSLPDANPNNTASVNFTVVFNSAVTGVDATDFSAYGSASAGTSIGVTPVSPTTYTVTVSGITLTGLVGLDVNDNNSIIDLAANPLGGPGVAAPFFSSATQYTIILAEPPNHVTAFTLQGASTTFTSMRVTWTDALGSPTPSGYLVSIERSSATAPAPADFGTPIADQLDLVTFTTGYQNIGPGVQQAIFSNLLSGETYTFKIYPYTNSGANIDFKIDGIVPTQSGTTPVDNFVWINSAGSAALEPISFPSTTTSSGVAVINFRFQVFDNGWGSADNASTKITQIRVQRDLVNDQIGNWFNALQGAELTDGVTTKTGTVDPGGNFITFTGLYDGITEFFGETLDNQNKYYFLKVILKTNLGGVLPQTIDNNGFVFQIRNADITVAANSSGLNAGNDGHPSTPNSAIGKNRVSVIATQLDFSTNPNPGQLVLTNVTSASTSPDFSTVPILRGRDLNGNTDVDYDATISLANAGSIATSFLSIAMNNGVAVFPAAFQYQDSGNGTLTATTSTVAANSLVPASGNSTGVTVNYSNTSTIIPGALAIPTTFSSLNTSAFVQVFDFRVVDDNGASGDGSPTKISQVVYTPGAGNDIADWSQAISQVAFWDGLNPFITGVIGTNSITFSGINTAGLGFVGDNATKNYQLYITLKPSLGGTLPDDIDNKNFVFEVLDDNILLDPQSSLFTGSEGTNSGATNIGVSVIATKLQFDTNPASVLLVGKDISLQPPVPIVEALDARNNRDLNYNSATVTVTNSLGLNMSNSPGNASVVSGLLTFPNNFKFNTTGTGATLTVSSTGPSVVTSSTSTPFDVRGGLAGTITAGALAEPLTISSLVDLTHTPAGLSVFDFAINDDPVGTPTGEDDGNPTQLTNMSITSGVGNTVPNWTEAFATATLSDGTNTVTVTSIHPSNYFYFDLSSVTGQALGLIPDNGTKTYELKIWLKTALDGTLPTTIDGLNFVFDVQQANIGTSASSSLILAGQSQNSGAGNNEVTVVATQIDFTTPVDPPLLPTAFASLNSPFQVVAQARDVNANRDLDFTAGASTITALSNASGATMTSSPAVVGSNFNAGLFNFPFTLPSGSVPPDFQFTTGSNGDDVTLSITAGGISSVPFPSPFTPEIRLISSFESALMGDPTFIPPATIPYISYQEASNIQNTATSYELVRALLIDGSRGLGFTYGGQPLNTITDSGDGLLNSDSDGASTNLTSLTLRIYNPSNLRRIALYGNGTEISGTEMDVTAIGAITPTTPFYDFVWNGSPLLTAADNNLSVLSVRVSFRDTAPEVTDQDDIQIQLIGANDGAGSKFFNGNPANSGLGIVGNLGPFVGGQTQPGGAGSLGKIDVVATRLDFTTQPAAFEGIQQPLSVTPQIRARDINQIVDLDHNFPGLISAVSAGLSATSFGFINGIVDLTGLQYSSTGDGTLTITSNSLSSNVGGSIPSTHVDVINVFTTLATGGVISSTNLPGGAVNRVIFGVTFNRPYVVTGQPKLNRFIINFSNPITGIFTNVRIFESTNTTFDGGDANVVTTGSIGATLTTALQSLTVDFTSGTPRDLSLPGNSQLTYFLMVDVSPTASGSTPTVQPSVPNSAANVLITNGSVFSGLPTLGQVYSFASIFPPTLVSSNPATGQLNVDKNKPTIDLVFSVPVWTMDSRISLYDQTTGLLVANLIAVNGQFSGGVPTLAGTVGNPLKFALPVPLLDDHVYYVNIEQGDFENSIGIVDESFNEFPGFTYSGTLYFKTANLNPPRLLNNNSIPVANNPTITNASLTGATINATFDQQGMAFFMVVNQGDPTPTTAQISGSAYGGTVVDRGSFEINQVNPISQFGQITAVLTPSTPYDVWIYAQNNALPTVVPTPSPYGSLANNFVQGTSGPTLTFTSPAVAQASGPLLPTPVVSICRNSFQTLNQPIQIVEGALGDFSNAGVQVFNLLLPSGFQFDVTTVDGTPTGAPLHGSLSVIGADFSGVSSLRFINTTTLRITFQNTGNSSRDNITISGLRVLAPSIASGDIVRLGGNALLAALPDLTVVATLSSFNAPTIDFTNEYSEFAFPLSVEPITIIPDDQGQVELIPLPSAGDYGPSAFSGSGVNINQLNVTAVTKDAPFNITLTHTDNNGCASDNPIQYTVYDHNAAIKGLSPTFCLDFVNLTGSAPTGTPALTQNVLFNNLGAHFMESLTATVPASATASSQKIFGTQWIALLNTLPFITATIPDATVLGRDYHNYSIDGAKILNANSFNSTIPNPYSHFINTTAQGNTYYDGGSLGFVEFTGGYWNQANQSVFIPLRQNVEFFVPAVPKVEVGLSNLSATAGLVSIFCQQGGNVIVNGYPAASVGSSVGFFSLEDNGTIIHARDLTVAITNQVDNGGNVQITLSKPANLAVNDAIQIFGVTGTLAFSGTHQITTKISNSIYVINRPFNPAATINAAKVTLSMVGFTDNGNGTAELDPTLFTNNFNDILINYTYKSNDSPCESSAALTIRIEPNPVAQMTFASTISPNTPVGSAHCEGNMINFDGSTSNIVSGTITSYRWDFTDATNSTGINPNIIAGPSATASHTFIQSAPYNPSLIATSSFGCSSLPSSFPLNVGIVPVTSFNLLGVSTADLISFTNTTVIPAGTVADGIATLDWDFGDGSPLAIINSAFGSPKTHAYSTAGPYAVNLKVTSNLGCTKSLSKDIIVLAKEIPTPTSSYLEDFETTNGKWQASSLPINSSATNPSSWAIGTPTTSVIKITDPVQFGTKVAKTNLTGTYNPQERSAWYSPSFDLSQLIRPMVSFNSFTQIETSDGVVLQYSVDNKNVADPTKEWDVVGERGEGVDWFTDQGITAKPGNQPDKDYGWSGINKAEWAESKHAISDDTGKKPLLGKTQVVFRFALASAKANISVDGFALDNFRIGERTRTILLENFTTSNGRNKNENDLVKAENDYVSNFVQSGFGTTVVKVNYHVGFTGEDPFNLDNPADPSARALYYNVKTVPWAFLDGDRSSGAAIDSRFSIWGQKAYDTQTLQLGQSEISVTTPTLNPDGSIKFDVQVKALYDLPENTILNVAVIEQSVDGTKLSQAKKDQIKTGETTHNYVLKKMLPNASGTRFGTVLKTGEVRVIADFEYYPDPAKLYENKDDMAIVVFLQNESTKNIYQTELITGINDPPLVTGLENVELIEHVEIFPNPADDEINVQLPGDAKQMIRLQMVDQIGRVVTEHFIGEGERSKTISTRDLAGGIYLLQLGSGDTSTRKKIMIVHGK